MLWQTIAPATVALVLYLLVSMSSTDTDSTSYLKSNKSPGSRKRNMTRVYNFPEDDLGNIHIAFHKQDLRLPNNVHYAYDSVERFGVDEDLIKEYGKKGSYGIRSLYYPKWIQLTKNTWAYRQYGDWSWSNAGLIRMTNGKYLLVDTLMDFDLTKFMLENLPEVEVVDEDGSVGAEQINPKEIYAIVHTHGDVDHIYGDMFLKRFVRNTTLIITSEGTAKKMEMAPRPYRFGSGSKMSARLWKLISMGHATDSATRKLSPEYREMLLRMKPWMAKIALKFAAIIRSMAMFDAFNVRAVFARVAKPDIIAKDFPYSLDDHVDLLQLSQYAHCYGEAVIHVKQDASLKDDGSLESVVFTGDILFNSITPIQWVGPASAFIKSLNELLDLNATYYVAGHGPVSDKRAIQTSIDYFTYLQSGVQECNKNEVRDEFECGLLLLEKLPEPFRSWNSPERIFINVAVEMRKVKDPNYDGKKDFLSLFSTQGRFRNELELMDDEQAAKYCVASLREMGLC